MHFSATLLMAALTLFSIQTLAKDLQQSPEYIAEQEKVDNNPETNPILHDDALGHPINRALKRAPPYIVKRHSIIIKKQAQNSPVPSAQSVQSVISAQHSEISAYWSSYSAKQFQAEQSAISAQDAGIAAYVSAIGSAAYAKSVAHARATTTHSHHHHSRASHSSTGVPEVTKRNPPSPSVTLGPDDIVPNGIDVSGSDHDPRFGEDAEGRFTLNGGPNDPKPTPLVVPASLVPGLTSTSALMPTTLKKKVKTSKAVDHFY